MRSLTGDACDLAVVGGGFTGLWTALLAKERDPARDVVLLEGREIGHAATGATAASATRRSPTAANGLDRYPDEMPSLERWAWRTSTEIERTVGEHAIDCGWSAPARSTWPPGLGARLAGEEYERARGYGHDVEWLDRDACRPRCTRRPTAAGPARRG